MQIYITVTHVWLELLCSVTVVTKDLIARTINNYDNNKEVHYKTVKMSCIFHTS